MLEVEFYSVKNGNFNKSLINILQDLLTTKGTLNLVVEEQELNDINVGLWSSGVFFPHCLATDDCAKQTPVVLYSFTPNLTNNYNFINNYTVLLNNTNISITNNISIVFNALNSNSLSYNRNRYKTLLSNNNINLKAITVN